MTDRLLSQDAVIAAIEGAVLSCREDGETDARTVQYRAIAAIRALPDAPLGEGEDALKAENEAWREALETRATMIANQALQDTEKKP